MNIIIMRDIERRIIFLLRRVKEVDSFIRYSYPEEANRYRECSVVPARDPTISNVIYSVNKSNGAIRW